MEGLTAPSKLAGCHRRLHRLGVGLVRRGEFDDNVEAFVTWDRDLALWTLAPRS